MALRQSAHAQRRETPPTGYVSGSEQVAIFTISFATLGYTAASDKLEFGVLPSNAQLVGADLIGEGLGAVTANVGLMAGEPGTNDDTRAVGSQIYAAESVNDLEARAKVKNCLAIAPVEGHRAIGGTLSANVAAGAGKKITLVIRYIH